MQPTARKPQVIIRHCDEYEPQRIRQIIREGLEALGLRPHGRTLVKPNIVCAGERFPYAYTRPEFVEGVLRALQDVDERQADDRARGRASAAASRCRRASRSASRAGTTMLKRVEASRSYYFEEEQQVEIPLTHEGRLRDYLFTPEPIARADFFVNCPKFKAHPWTTVTFSHEELHRHPGRSASPDRSRSQAQREDRGPPAHHPAAVHRDRRDHRRRGPHAHADRRSTWA